MYVERRVSFSVINTKIIFLRSRLTTILIPVFESPGYYFATPRWFCATQFPTSAHLCRHLQKPPACVRLVINLGTWYAPWLIPRFLCNSRSGRQSFLLVRFHLYMSLHPARQASGSDDCRGKDSFWRKIPWHPTPAWFVVNTCNKETQNPTEWGCNSHMEIRSSSGMSSTESSWHRGKYVQIAFCGCVQEKSMNT